MAAVTTVIAAIAAAAAVAGTAVSISAQDSARKQAHQAADEQRKVRSEQMAANAQQAAEAQRQQVREARVRRARILQSGVNSGTEFSSGEMGSLGSLATGFSENTGNIAGGYDRGVAISNYSQNAADFTFASQSSQQTAATASQVSQLGGSIFNAAGGFNTLGKAADTLGQTSTIFSYGTNYGSQQTKMLADQDSGF